MHFERLSGRLRGFLLFTAAAAVGILSAPAWGRGLPTGFARAWSGMDLGGVQALNPTGDLMASQGGGVLRILDVKSGETLDAFEVGSTIEKMAWGRGRLLVAGSREVWSYGLESGAYSPLGAHDSLRDVTGLAPSPDGKWVAAAGTREGRATLCLFPSDGGQPRVIPLGSSASPQIAWTSSGKIATQGPTLIDPRGGVTRLGSHQGELAASPGGRLLLQISGRTAYCYRSEDGSLLWSSPLPSRASSGWVRWMDGGNVLAFRSAEGPAGTSLILARPAAGLPPLGQFRLSQGSEWTRIEASALSRRLVVCRKEDSTMWDKLDAYDVGSSGIRAIARHNPQLLPQREISPTQSMTVEGRRIPAVALLGKRNQRPAWDLLAGRTGLSRSQLSLTQEAASALSSCGRWLLEVDGRGRENPQWRLIEAATGRTRQKISAKPGATWLEVGTTGMAAVKTANGPLLVRDMAPGSSGKSFSFEVWTSAPKDLSHSGTRVTFRDWETGDQRVVNCQTGRVISAIPSAIAAGFTRVELASEGRMLTLERTTSELAATLWDITEPEARAVAEFRSPLRDGTSSLAAVSADAGYVALAQSFWSQGASSLRRKESRIDLFSVETGQLIQSWQNPQTGDGYFDLAFSPDGSQIYVSHEGGGVFSLLTPSTVTQVVAESPSVKGGQTAELRVKMAGPAPVDTLLRLHSDSPDLRVPDSVVVPAGSDEAVAPIRTVGASEQSKALVWVSGKGPWRSASLRLEPASQVALTLPDQPLGPGETGSGRVTLNAAAGSRGARVRLALSNPEAGEVPPEVVIPPGESSASFEVKARRVVGLVQSTLLAALVGRSIQSEGSLTIQGSDPPLPKPKPPTPPPAPREQKASGTSKGS